MGGGLCGGPTQSSSGVTHPLWWAFVGATFSPNGCKSRLVDTDFPFNKVVDSFSLAKDAIGCLIIKTHCGHFSLAEGAIWCLIIKTHCGLFLLAEGAIRCLIIKTHCGLFWLAEDAIGCLIIKTHCGLFSLAEDAIGV